MSSFKTLRNQTYTVGSGSIGSINATIPNGFIASNPYGNVTVSVISPTEKSNISIAPSQPVKLLQMTLENNEPVFTFFETTGDKKIKAVYAPDYSITPQDLNRIAMLITACAEGMFGFKPISYIRTHNLERHFSFSEE